MLSTPKLEELVNQVSQYVNSYMPLTAFKCPYPPKDFGMIVESGATEEAKKAVSIRDLRIQTRQ